MKRVLIVAALLGVLSASIIGPQVDSAYAATDYTNWCTSTYTLPSGPAVFSSGSDSVIVRRLDPPIILVSKSARNLRTGVENPDQVAAVAGDTIEFTIVWSNAGEAPADSLTLTDYIPSGMTYVPGSATETAAYTSGSVDDSGGRIQWTTDAYNDVPGTASGTPANGIIRFRATVNP